MKLLKRVCVLKQVENGYSYSGKQAKAMAKCQKIGTENSVSLSFMDLAPLKHGSYIIVVGNSEKCVYFPTDETGTQKDFHDCSVDFALPFSISVVVDDGEKIALVLFGQTPDCNETPLSIKNAYVTQKREKEKELEKTEKIIDEFYQENDDFSNEVYSDDVVATENYFENSDVDLENLTLIEDKSETVDCSFLQEDLEEIMSSFPPFEELEKSVYGSKWVKIQLEKGEYYFGKASIHDEKYLCYAVRGKKGCCPEELKSLACFIPAPKADGEDGFFVMFQKEKNGEVIKK